MLIIMPRKYSTRYGAAEQGKTRYKPAEGRFSEARSVPMAKIVYGVTINIINIIY